MAFSVGIIEFIVIAGCCLIGFVETKGDTSPEALQILTRCTFGEYIALFGNAMILLVLTQPR